jgi:hypothetical protein
MRMRRFAAMAGGSFFFRDTRVTLLLVGHHFISPGEYNRPQVLDAPNQWVSLRVFIKMAISQRE